MIMQMFVALWCDWVLFTLSWIYSSFQFSYRLLNYWKEGESMHQLPAGMNKKKNILRIQ